jgi:hypothetical protein
MDSIPIHMRITGLTVSNEDVDSRRAAVADLATTWGKIKEANAIMAKAAQIAESLSGDGTPATAFGAEVEGAVQKHASAFLYSERPLDVGVCAGMAAVSLMNSQVVRHGWQIVDVYSNALWSALAFQPVLEDGKRETLRREVLDRAQERSVLSANKARERDVVADAADLTVTIGEGNKVTTNFKKAVSNTIEALRRNAALDREELDVLWWVQLSRSRLLLGRPLADIPEPVRLVACGIEGAGHLRRLPADVHRDLILRTVDEDPELDLRELITAIGEDRKVLGGQFTEGGAIEHPSVFPLLNALATGTVSGAGAALKRKASTWGARALLEAGLIRMMNLATITL